MVPTNSVLAYSLIIVNHGADQEVLTQLIALEGVTEASLIYGEFDIHCRIEVETMDQLKQVIADIRKMRVRTTETLITYEKIQKRVSRLTNGRVGRQWHNRTQGR